MTTPELEQLKSKYPLAFDTIKLPVRYVNDSYNIVDSGNEGLARTYPIFRNNDIDMKRQDQIGELICELLNQLQ